MEFSKYSLKRKGRLPYRSNMSRGKGVTPLCRVCGDNCTPRTHQPQFCSACDLFTWRILDKNEVFTCNFNNSCPVTKKNRRCRSCRIRKITGCWVEHYQKMSRRRSTFTKIRKLHQDMKVRQLRDFVARIDAAEGDVHDRDPREGKKPSSTQDEGMAVDAFKSEDDRSDDDFSEEGEELVTSEDEGAEQAPAKVVENLTPLINTPGTILHLPFLKDGVAVNVLESIDKETGICRMTFEFASSSFNETFEYVDIKGDNNRLVMEKVQEPILQASEPKSSVSSYDYLTDIDGVCIKQKTNTVSSVEELPYTPEFYKLLEIYLRLRSRDRDTLSRFCKDLGIGPLNIGDLFPEIIGNRGH
ncbi:vitamin D3 receptor B-like [Ischnura elegans]|uniref:vitamin D3 receptor B-like n=1 Tax=Ischnura elegans TaxID=197161 RepID=UPI001ED87B4C|nr:vitamin D3 receptor B-like [Ischnura elegans]